MSQQQNVQALKKSYLDIIVFEISARGEKSHYLSQALCTLLEATKSFVFLAKCDSADGKRLFIEVFSDGHGFWPSLPALWEVPDQSELRVGKEVRATVPLQTSFGGERLHNAVPLIRSLGSWSLPHSFIVTNISDRLCGWEG